MVRIETGAGGERYAATVVVAIDEGFERIVGAGHLPGVGPRESDGPAHRICARARDGRDGIIPVPIVRHEGDPIRARPGATIVRTGMVRNHTQHDRTDGPDGEVHVGCLCRRGKILSRRHHRIDVATRSIVRSRQDHVIGKQNEKRTSPNPTSSLFL